ncbi:MAG: rhomboid family intramembrane serine protease [Candidatus Zixiibacteriota bacterium]
MLPLKDDNPTYHMPIVTMALIALNVIVHLYQMSLGPEAPLFVIEYGLIPYELVRGVELTPQLAVPSSLNVITSMFIHGGLFHLGGNMLYLWIFGNNVEDVLRPIHYVIFYILSGIFASLLFVATSPNTDVPLVGASGAVSGVLGAYVARWPRARILTLIFFGWFIRIVWIPAIVVLGLWFFMQLLFSLPSLGTPSSGGVAYMAHVGGFAFGFAYAKLLRGSFER